MYITATLRNLALSLIGIFLPIYIIELPSKISLFSDTFFNGIAWVLVYFMIRSIITALFTLFLSNFIFLKLTLRKSILVSSLILSLELCTLLVIEKGLNLGYSSCTWLIILAGILRGLSITFYWIPFHIFFIRKTDGGDQRYGKEISTRVFLVKLSSVVAPILGGLIISRAGFHSAFIISIFLLIVSTFPIVFNLNEGVHDHHNPTTVIRNYLFNPKLKLITLAYFGNGAEALVYTIFWPILLFIVLESFIKVGAITSISILISSLVVLWVGKTIDKHGRTLLHSVGVTLNTLFYLPRLFSSSQFLLYSLDIVDRVNGVLYSLPFITNTYEKAVRLGDSDFIIYREIAIHIAIAVTAALLLILLPFLPNWRYVFIIAIVGSATSFLMSVDKN